MRLKTTPATVTVLATIPGDDDATELRVSLQTRLGRSSVSVRLWRRDGTGSGGWRPAGRGVSIAITAIGATIEALRRGRAIVTDIDDDDAPRARRDDDGRAWQTDGLGTIGRRCGLDGDVSR